MAIDSTLEIRKLPLSHITQLSSILEFADDWKKLMAIVPNSLSKDNYECCVSYTNPAKYNSNHVQLIETASTRDKRTGTEILLDEWGCSGRIRPTVGHLFHLLQQANLYRAADYVAVKILNVNRPPRPLQGPAAFVPTKLEGRVVEEILGGFTYNSSLIENAQFTLLDENLDYTETLPTNIPKIVITPDAEAVSNIPDFSHIYSPNVGNQISAHPSESVLSSCSQIESEVESTDELSTSNGVYTTDSQVEKSGSLPLLSELSSSESSIQNNTRLNSEENSSEIDIPQCSLLNHSTDGPNLSILNQTSEDIIPMLTELQTNSVSGYEIEDPDVSNLLQSSAHIPDLGELMSEHKLDSTSSVMIPDISLLNSSLLKDEEDNTQEQNASVPNLSMLIPEMQRRSSLTVSTATMDSTKSRPCPSPLPNLILNTNLPHYTYCELEACTNNFNEDQFIGVGGQGRLLGSGAFGKVFLAFGLLNRPVAVKKIILENVEVVNIDDRVTKQFVNEVEVLSRFQHKNLLSLLGYSRDGCTYCLLYEYISGGTLKDRLMNTTQKLMWEERLHVALGTAEAISYLHTEFSSPLIHRDIKTANILLDKFNIPKLGDFGIIKLLNNQNTNTGTVIGTTAYMAPEALRGDISVKCDTFSFGVVLLELLTSLPSFDDKRDGNDLVTHVQEQCEESIHQLLDTEVGNWMKNDVNFSDEVYSLATSCLMEKKKRPVMVDVGKILEEMIAKL